MSTPASFSTVTGAEWSALGAQTRIAGDGLIPPDEVAAIYRPFSRLRANVLATRWRASLILEKGPDHAVRRIRIRDR